MQKLQVRIVAAILGLGILLADNILIPKPVVAQPCRTKYPGKNPSLWRNRTAAVAVQNTTKYNVTITLYHPDSGRPNGSWTVKPNSFTWVPRSDYTIGDDWGIQVNNSCIYYIDEITTYGPPNGGPPMYKVYVDYEEPEGFQLEGYILLKKNLPRKAR